MSVAGALHALAASLSALPLTPSPHPAPSREQWAALGKHVHAIVGRAAILCAPPAPPSSLSLVDTLASGLHDLLGGGLALAREALVGDALLPLLTQLVIACEAWLLALSQGNEGTERIAQSTGSVTSALDRLKTAPVSTLEAAIVMLMMSEGAVKDASTELAESMAEEDEGSEADSDAPRIPTHLRSLAHAALQLVRLANVAVTRVALAVKDVPSAEASWLEGLVEETRAVSALVDDLVCALYDDDQAEDLFTSTCTKLDALVARVQGGMGVKAAHAEMLSLLADKVAALAVPETRPEASS